MLKRYVYIYILGLLGMYLFAGSPEEMSDALANTLTGVVLLATTPLIWFLWKFLDLSEEE